MRWTPAKLKLLISSSLAVSCVFSTRAQDCLLMDDFELGDVNGWWEETEDDAVEFADGVLRIHFEGPNTLSEWGVLRPCVYSDFQIDVDLRDLEATVNKIVVFHSSGSVRDFDGYGVNLRSSPWNDVVLVRRTMEDQGITLASAYEVHETGEWKHVQIIMEGARIRVSVDGVERIDIVDPEPIETGWMGLAVNAGGGGEAFAEFDNFAITPLNEAVANEAISWSAMKAHY